MEQIIESLGNLEIDLAFRNTGYGNSPTINASVPSVNGNAGSMIHWRVFNPCGDGVAATIDKYDDNEYKDTIKHEKFVW